MQYNQTLAVYSRSDSILFSINIYKKSKTLCDVDVIV